MKKLLARAGKRPPSASCPSDCDTLCRAQQLDAEVRAEMTRETR